MQNKNYWLSSGILTMAERFSTLILGFGSFSILVRSISTADFGTWALFLSVTTLIELARNGLIQNAVVKFLTTAEPGQRKIIITASLALNCILTLISILALYFLAPVLANYWHTPVLLPMFRYYIFTTLILVLFSQFNFIQQANFDFKGIMISNMIRQFCFFSYIVYLYFAKSNPDLVELVHFQTLSALIGAISSVFFVKKYFEMSTFVQWHWVGRLFHYGKYVFGTNISSVFFKTADQMILGHLSGTAAVGSYNAAARISNLFEVPVSSIASIVFPHGSKRIHEEGESVIKELYEKSVAAMLAIILPAILLVVLIPKLILTVLTGSKFAGMAFVLQIIVVQNLFLPYLRQFGTILDAVGRPHVNFGFIVANAILNIVVNYYMISWYGLEGAAWGSLFVYTLCTLFVGAYMKQNFQISFVNTITYTFAFYPKIVNIIREKLKI